jgi:3-oxoacyl-[acyl-carrier protein] reductase/pyridoxal 4-dehydrogenase
VSFEGRVAIVTGAAQGIGAAVARELAAAGAAVAIADRNGAGARSVAAGLDDALGLEVDVSDPTQVESLVAETLSRYDRLDVLVNAAAMVPFTAWDALELDEWRQLMSINLDGIYLTTKAVEKPMRAAGYGRIVNIASNTVLCGIANVAHYIASKGGVFAFTRATARELGPYGITVNSVAPGLTATEGVLASEHGTFFDAVVPQQCIPRRGEARDIAPVVAFLASEGARWVTGQMVVVDGGHTFN